VHCGNVNSFCKYNVGPETRKGSQERFESANQPTAVRRPSKQSKTFEFFTTGKPSRIDDQYHSRGGHPAAAACQENGIGKTRYRRIHGTGEQSGLVFVDDK
jgi:hypothetical protein